MIYVLTTMTLTQAQIIHTKPCPILLDKVAVLCYQFLSEKPHKIIVLCKDEEVFLLFSHSQAILQLIVTKSNQSCGGCDFGLYTSTFELCK